MVASCKLSLQDTIQEEFKVLLIEEMKRKPAISNYWAKL